MKMPDVKITPAPAVFLDRDGTLNVDKGYVSHLRDWEWLPHALDGLRKLKNAGFKLVVVTNQSGIARGYYPADDVIKLHDLVNRELNAKGVGIDAFYFCPHHPEYSGPCSCRKPKPGLIQKAALEMNLDLSRSWMIGDKGSDIEAGSAAGIPSILIGEHCQIGQEYATFPHVPIVEDLEKAADLIINTYPAKA